MGPLDWVLREARIAGAEDDVVDIGISSGRIVAIAPALETEAPSESAHGL